MSSLSFSFIDKNTLANNVPEQPVPGLGLYTGTIPSSWAPPYIKPTSSEYMKQFYAQTHNPSFTRIGNNDVEINSC